MSDTEAVPTLMDLTDELLAAGTLLALMKTPGADWPVLLEMCSDAVERCQALTHKLAFIDSRTN